MSKFNSDLGKEVEKIVADGGDVIDAICYICEKYGIDIETAASFVKRDAVLKSKVQIEAENLNILKKSARLPI